MGYLDGGGEGEFTLHRNRSAFDDLEIVPTVLRDVSDVDTSTHVFGEGLPSPIALAPVGAPRLFHHDGEIAAARAARAAGLPYGVSTLATTSLEDIAAASSGPLWFQLYLWGDRSVAKDLVERAHDLGYHALLISVDVTVRSKRERELHAGLTLPMPHLRPASLLDGALHPDWAFHFVTSPAPSFPNVSDKSAAQGASELSAMFDGTITWHDIEWLRETWDRPLLLKGVLNVEEASRAAGIGLDGVVVSNHGGRQLDHVPATIEVLPDIARAVGDRIEVLLDSGIRRGTDILTAIALGARAVLIGRAYLYGLAASGEAGVAHAIDILEKELRTAMALAGARKIEDLRPEMIRRRTITGADSVRRSQ